MTKVICALHKSQIRQPRRIRLLRHAHTAARSGTTPASRRTHRPHRLTGRRLTPWSAPKIMRLAADLRHRQMFRTAPVK
jgi:hypothetical protein